MTKAFPTRRNSPRTVIGMQTAPTPRRIDRPIQTPWGPTALVERLELRQRAGEKRFASAIELLETQRGERLVRFAYTTNGSVRRGPVTLRARDLERLRAQIRSAPGLAELLGLRGA